MQFHPQQHPSHRLANPTALPTSSRDATNWSKCAAAPSREEDGGSAPEATVGGALLYDGESGEIWQLVWCHKRKVTGWDQAPLVL